MKRRCPTPIYDDGEGNCDLVLVESTADRTAIVNSNRNVSEKLIVNPSTNEQTYSITPLATEASAFNSQQKRSKASTVKTSVTAAKSSLSVNSHESEEVGAPECIAEESHRDKLAGRNDVEKKIEAAILSLATQRGTQKTFCPSEIPRLILKLPNWRDYMDLTRKIAFRMAASGIVDITQKGVVRTASEYESLTGPMRIRLSSSWLTE